jgi:hypothetical protein
MCPDISKHNNDLANHAFQRDYENDNESQIVESDENEFMEEYE